MDAADSACREESDVNSAADGECASDRRRADGALNGGDCGVARPDLAGRGVEPGELLLGDSDDDLSVEHADGRRDGSGLPYRALRGEPDLDTLARRKSVRDERRLQRHDPEPFGLRGTHLFGDADHGIAPSFVQQRAAAASPAVTPATR